ncbi:MAG: WD40/YVTN/BNR-like repeat-containing protein [Acidimicrobiales bacterium]
MTSWSAFTLKTTIYRTNDGGKTWSTVAGASHSENAGAATLIDLVSPTTAFEEDLEPTGPGMSLAVTTDSGRTWKSVYNFPPPTASGNGRDSGPFEMPMSFADPMHGFAASGVPPAEPPTASGDFFTTSDGGSTWVRQLPPLPNIPVVSTCPTGVTNISSTSCVFALPTFSDSRQGVLAAVVTTGTKAYVAFDVTSDGGQHWTRTSQQSVTVSPSGTQGGVQGRTGFGYPLICEPSATSWWLLGWSAFGAATKVTTDAGSNWSTNTAPLPAGVPTSLAALDATRAVLTMEDVTANGTTTQVLTTTNSGRTWARLHLPG